MNWLHIYKRSTIHLMLVILVFLFMACDGDTIHNPGDSAEISIVSGNDQIGTGGQPLAQSIVVQVTTSNGGPAKHMDVRFNVIEGGGQIQSGVIKRTDSEGMATAEWIIGSGYNGIELTLAENVYQVPPAYVWATGENPTGLHETKTIGSLHRINSELYEMTFAGDYGPLLDEINQTLINSFSNPKIALNDYGCSLFSAYGNPEAALFGRSFDNASDWERCISMVVRCAPPDGYESITLVRVRDVGYLGYLLEGDITALSFEQKRRLLETVYIPPDGINEHGVVAGLAQLSPRSFQPDGSKPSIYKTRWIREILDHAASVDEAVVVTRRFNIVEDNLSSLANHLLLSDPSGRSVILELNNGEIQVVPMAGNFQVMTNTYVYNEPVEVLKRACSRYNTIHQTLETAHGFLDISSAFDILETVGYWNTEWSAVYNMTTKEALVVTYMDFENVQIFSIENN